MTDKRCVHALRAHEHGPVFVDAPAPEAGEGLLVIRVVRAAVEPADVQGARAGVTLGRRFVGVIGGATGGDQADHVAGQRVVGSPELACGSCDLCRTGLSAHCRDRRTLGVDADGCLARFIALPPRNVAALPDSVGDDLGALAWTLAESLHTARLAPESRYVTVIGDDLRALLIARAVRAGNDGARVLMPTRELFPIAERWGIAHRLTDEPGRRADQDVVIVASSAPQRLDLAMRLVRPRGRIVVQSPAAGTIDAAHAAEHEIEIVGARGGVIAEGVSTLARGGIEASLLIAQRVRFEQLVKGMPDWRRGLTIVEFD